jgi:LysM repeat protein
MKMSNILESRNYLYEGLDASSLRSVKLWESAGRKLVEYQMTPDQITKLFAQVQQSATAAGSNRTMIGKGKDAADAVGQAWEDLKTKVQNSGPIKNVDAAYDQAAAKLKQATGGDAGVMQYVEKYRKFAKEHPIAQSLIYAALIAAAGISGAGAGGAAALGLLKMTDKLLQGAKFSSAAYAGAKTGALAYGASHLADYFKKPDTAIPPKTDVKLPDGTDYVVQKGDTLSQIAQKNGVSVDDLMKANSGQSIAVGGPTADPAFTQVDTMGNYTGTATDPADIVTRTKLTNPDVLKPGQNLFVPTSAGPTPTYQGGVGTAADTWNKVKSGIYDPSQISANQAAKYNLPGAVASPNTVSGATNVAKGAAKGGYDTVQNAATQAAINAQTNSDWDDEIGQRVAGAGNLAGTQSPKAQFPTGINPRAKIGIREANRKTKLSEAQIKRMFYVAGTLQDKLTEGVWDKIKGAAGKAATAVSNKAQTIGTNLTTKVTADKLMTAWKKAGAPTDSDAVAVIMKQAGVDDAIIASSMKAVGGQSAPANITPPTDATTPANTTTPAPVDAQTQKFIQQLVASYTALTPEEKQQLKKELQDAVTASDVGSNVVKATNESKKFKKRVR